MCPQLLGDPDQKKLLCERLQPEIASLSKDNYGCRVVQKAGEGGLRASSCHLPLKAIFEAIGAVSKDLQVLLSMSLQDNVGDCIVNMPPSLDSIQAYSSYAAGHVRS